MPPWEKYGQATPAAQAPAAPPPFIAGTPKPAGRYEAQDQQFQANSDARASDAAARSAAADARAAEAAERARREWEATHNPDGTSKAKAPTAETARIPANAATGIQENLKVMRAIDDAIMGVEARRSSIGPGTGMLGDTFTQFNDPQGTSARAGLAGIGAAKIHDLSGAAVSASEAPRFTPFVPTVTDRPEVALDKLQKFRTELEAQIKEANNFYSPANGYFPYQTPGMADALGTTPQGEAPPPPPSFGGQKAPPQASGQIAGVGMDNGGDPLEIARGGVSQVDDPTLAGVRGQYRARLARGQSADEIIAWANSAGIDPSAHQSIREQVAYRLRNPKVPLSQYDTSELDDKFVPLSGFDRAQNAVASGQVLGVSPGAAAIGAADAASLGTLDNIIGMTGGSAERARIGMGQIQQNNPGSYLTGQVAGSVSTNLLGEAGLARAGMGSGLGRTTGANALLGFGGGAGSSDYNSQGGQANIGDRVGGGMYGATINALGGLAGTGVVKGIQSTVSPVARAANRSVGRDPNTAINQVSMAIGEDNLTPRGVAKIIAEGRERGVPMTIADTGENSRELLASVGRQRGESRNIAKVTTANRQEQQLERISSAVRRDLGPTANIREMGDELMSRAKDEAAPIYKEAFAAPGAGAAFPKIQRVLGRPSVKGAMVRAQRIAAEEGRDPTALGFELGTNGEVTLTRVPSWETLHYIKTGLDDVIESYRDKTSGKLVLDAEGRLINNTKNQLLKDMDAMNPAYKDARAAYGGPVSMRDALELGSKAFSRSPDDVAANIKNLGPAEMEMYRLGLRKGVMDILGSKGDYADKVKVLIGTPKARAVLTKVLGGNKEFDRFIATLKDEQAVSRTYNAVHGNSSTAGRVAFDETTTGENVAGHAVDVLRAGQTGGMFGAGSRAVEKVMEGGRLGAGAVGDQARAQIAALLSESNPEQLTEIAKQAQRAAAKARLGKRTNQKQAVRAGTVGAAISGALGLGTSPDQ